jgi:hypothetical protein
VTEKRVVKVTNRKIRKAGVSELADNKTAMAVLESSALKTKGVAAIAPDMRR